MSINFRTVTFFVAVAAIGLSACSKPDTDVDIPDIDSYLKGTVLTCSKPEAEIPVSEEAAKNVILAEDDVTTQDVEITGCEGESLGKEKKTVDGFTKNITIEKSADLKEPVGSIVIENLRTCASSRAEASFQTLTLKVPGENGEEKEIEIPSVGPQATFDGDLKIALFQSEIIRADLGLSILEGKNVLQIKYFGKCRKYQEATENQRKSCIDHDLIGQKSVLVEVKMNRIHKEEIGKEVRCKKDPKSDAQPESTPDPKPGF